MTEEDMLPTLSQLPREPEREQPSSLVPELLSEYLKVSAARTEVTLMAKVRALAQQDHEKRAPVTICAVIDRSASMKKHLPLLKETLQFMVQQLRSDDKLAIITFDHEVKTELALTAMTTSGKLLADEAIEKVKERGHTNLSGGLLAALELLYRIPSKKSSLVESVLVFTDGKANVGIRTQAPLVKAASSMVGQIGRHVSVFTFGYGGEHDSDLLQAVGEAGNGLFYYIDNADSIPESFCDCLGGLLSVAAQNVKLTLRAADRVRLHKPITTYQVTEKEEYTAYEVAIPDIYSEEEKCILFKVTVPGSTTAKEAENLSLASCHVQYFDVHYSRPVEHGVDCITVLNPSLDKPVPSDAVDEIELHKLRCEVADSLGQANKMADQGNFRGARDALHRANMRVRGSRVCRQVLAVHLMETLQESLDGLQDKVTYMQHGKSTMQNYAGSHWQQRSNTTPSSGGYIKHKIRVEGGAAMMPPTQHTSSTTASTQRTITAPYRNSLKKALITKHNHLKEEA